jgi:replicative DNA helicase
MSSADQKINTMENLSSRMAEESVIGGMLLNAETDGALYALEKLHYKDFYFRDCSIAWQAIQEMSAASRQIDLITVSDWIDTNKLGLEFSELGAMAKSTPSQANIRAYADIVKQNSKLRFALVKCHEACEALYGAGDSEERLKVALDSVSQIGQDESDSDIRDPVDVMDNVFQIMAKAFSSKTGLIGISSGLENIDAFTQGFQAPDIIVVAAPPSMGKTTFSLNFAEYAAFLDPNPKNVLFFSLEMSAEQLMQKTIANLGSLYLKKIKTGKALDDTSDIGRLENAQRIIQARRQYFRIDDKAGQTIAEMKSRAKRVAMKMGGLDLIVVDYLHLIQPSNQNDGPIEVITKNIQGLKQLAKQLKCPIIVLSQLNRGFTGRPEMKNLLGSSIIEQTADIIFFLYDQDYQGQRGDHSLTEVIVAKSRMGETGSTFLQPELGMSRFRDTQRLPKPEEPQKKTFKRFDE